MSKRSGGGVAQRDESDAKQGVTKIILDDCRRIWIMFHDDPCYINVINYKLGPKEILRAQEIRRFPPHCSREASCGLAAKCEASRAVESQSQ